MIVETWTASNGVEVRYVGLLRRDVAVLGQRPSPRFPEVPWAEGVAATRLVRRACGGLWPHQLALCCNVIEELRKSLLVAERAPRREALLELLDEREVLAMGRSVTGFLGGPEDAPYFEAVRVGSLRVVTVPHPSGYDRPLEDPEMRVRWFDAVRLALCPWER